jgi:carbon-monoxide dehydrogenase small subunit
MTSAIELDLTLNGRAVRVSTSPGRLLRDLLREGLGLTGTKDGCRDGMCGACAVHLDGEVVKSCLVLAGELDGRHVTTIEGLADGDRLHPVQRAMSEQFAIQCGFCTPGMVMTIAALAAEDGPRTDDEIREALAGNICRCTGYVRIVAAARAAFAELRPADPADAVDPADATGVAAGSPPAEEPR